MKYLTPRQLAERWHYRTPKTIYTRKHAIGYIKIGGKILFPLDKIEQYEERQTIEPEEGDRKAVAHVTA